MKKYSDRTLIKSIASVLYFCITISTIFSQCPDIEIVDLRNVPGYAQFDDLSVCGEPDTLSFIVYTGDPGSVLGFELELDLPDGLEYGGWEYTAFGGTAISVLDPDPTEPVFLVDGFDGDSLIVVHIAVQANCEVDLNNILNLNYSYEYQFISPNNVMYACSNKGGFDNELNSAIKIPVLNVLDGLSPAEVTITSIGGEFCQDISISQDGISSYLDSFYFEISGLAFDGDLLLNSITANSSENVPFTYDSNTEITTAVLKEDMFLGNNLSNPVDQEFNTNEILILRVCYELSTCPKAAN